MQIKLEFTLSIQSIIALIALILIAVWPILLAAIYSPKFMIANLPMLLAGAIVIVIFLGMRVYEINCFVYGGCVWHSWLMVGLSLLLTLLYCIYLTRYVQQMKWESEDAKEKLQENIRNSMGQVANNKMLSTITRGASSTFNSAGI